MCDSIKKRVRKNSYNILHIFSSFSMIFFLLGCTSNIAQDIPAQPVNEEQAWSSFYYGLQMEQEENIPEALEAFEVSFAMTSQEPRIYLHMANCFRQLGDMDNAIHCLKTAEKLANERKTRLDKDYLFYCDLAHCYHSMNERESARMLYEKALTIEPNFQRAQIYLMMLQEMLPTILPKQ